MSHERPLCVCCGRPRQPFTGKDRCCECRRGYCKLCRPAGFVWPRKSRKPKGVCACGAGCWRRGGQCYDCAMKRTWQDNAQGPYLCESPRMHEYHRRAMLGIELFDTLRSDR